MHSNFRLVHRICDRVIGSKSHRAVGGFFTGVIGDGRDQYVVSGGERGDVGGGGEGRFSRRVLLRKGAQAREPPPHPASHRRLLPARTPTRDIILRIKVRCTTCI